MKKAIMLLLAALCTAATTLAYDFQSGDLYYYITSDTTVAVVKQKLNFSTNYQGLSTAIIPETVTYNGTTYSVTRIGSEAFKGCSSLTSITIPTSVTSIGSWAFDGCSSLTSITIPNSVTSIGGYAFNGCSSLTSITIPNSVTSIGKYAFFRCSSLTSITIPNSVTSIGDSVFQNCSSLTSITIPNSVTSIGDHAFYGCSSLTSLTIPNSVTSIGHGAFACCSSLTSVTIPNSVTSIGNSAFRDCSSLTSITIPNSVRSIGRYAFADCSYLIDIYSYATTPPVCAANTFDGVSKNYCYIHVPAGTIRLYQVAPVWREFFQFYEISEETAISETEQQNNPSRKIIRDGQVLILRNGVTYDIMGNTL